MVTAASLARVVEQLDSSGKMVKGQQLVAQAWIDKDFKTRQRHEDLYVHICTCMRISIDECMSPEAVN